jgi:hypothetical protein
MMTIGGGGLVGIEFPRSREIASLGGYGRSRGHDRAAEHGQLKQVHQSSHRSTPSQPSMLLRRRSAVENAANGDFRAAKGDRESFMHSMHK